MPVTRQAKPVTSIRSSMSYTKTAQERASLEDAVFGIQSRDAFDKMVSASVEKMQKFYDSLKYTSDDSMGSVALQAETMLDNLKGRITLFQSAAEGFGNAIYKHLKNSLKELAEIETDYVSELAESLGSVLANAASTISVCIPSAVEMGDFIC